MSISAVAARPILPIDGTLRALLAHDQQRLLADMRAAADQARLAADKLAVIRDQRALSRSGVDTNL
jgi:alkylation response protein AidB-like acyl-CoA dehydrogenase